MTAITQCVRRINDSQRNRSAAGRDDDPELSPPAGEARSWRGVVWRDQRAPGFSGASAEDGDDCGRKHHRGAAVDEEPHAVAGSGDAPGEEGQSVAYWDEGAHRRGFGVGFGAQHGHHGGELSVRGDAAYACIGKRLETRGCGVDWQVAMRPGLRRHSEPVAVLAALERRKASIRAKVVHPFLYAYGCIGK